MCLRDGGLVVGTRNLKVKLCSTGRLQVLWVPMDMPQMLFGSAYIVCFKFNTFAVVARVLLFQYLSRRLCYAATTLIGHPCIPDTWPRWGRQPFCHSVQKRSWTYRAQGAKYPNVATICA